MAQIDFDDAYKKHAQLVYRYLLQLCYDEHLAEDLLQTTFLKAIEKIDSFDERSKLSSWLCQIAKNSFLDYVKKHKEIADIESAATAQTPPDFEDRLSDKSQAQLIQKIVHTLPDPYKEVFLLRVYAESSYRDISAMFSKSEVWGRVTYLRAKEMVLKKLNENEGLVTTNG